MIGRRNQLVQRALGQHSVFVAGDSAGWAIDDETDGLRETVDRLGYFQPGYLWSRSDAVFYMDRYRFLKNAVLAEPFAGRRIGLSYFHGLPENSKGFRKLFSRLKNQEAKIGRIRVSTNEMFQFLANEGFSERVQRIPIGIDINRFSLSTAESRQRIRRKFNIPSGVPVIGSFQKDGNGWGRGGTPKLIKGPDILADSLEIIARSYPDLVVVLGGAARGYVVNELAKRGIRFIYLPQVDRQTLASLYHALDLYIIPSRIEGGPKSFLEALSSGIPVVSTPVGQVVDLVLGSEARVTKSFSPGELAQAAVEELSHSNVPGKRITRREFAGKFSWESQDNDWCDFFATLLEA